jgi:multiple sugar transport system substrate-binding protein
VRTVRIGRWRYALALAAVPLLLLAAAVLGPDQEPERRLRLAIAVDVSSAPDGSGGVYRELITRWERDNPGWRVEVDVLPPEADQQRSQMAVDLQSSGPGYDVLRVDNQWIPEFAERGWIEPVDTGDRDLEWSGFLERARDSVCYEDRSWAVPFHVDIGLLFYRADWVHPDEVTGRVDDEGWAGLFALAAQVRDEHGVPYGYAGQFGDYEGRAVNGLEVVYGVSGDPFRTKRDRACATATDVTTSLEEAQDVFGTAVDEHGVMPEDVLHDNEADTLARFHRGDVVFMRHWPYAVGALGTETGESEEGMRWVGWEGAAEGEGPAFGVLPLPASMLGGQSLAVTSRSPHADQAWSLVRAMTDLEAQERLREAELLPGRSAGYEFATPDDADRHYWSALGRTIEQGRLRPRTPYYPQVSEVLRENVGVWVSAESTRSSGDDELRELTCALRGRDRTCQ